MATTLVKIPNKQSLIRYLQWDSDFFGLPVASLGGGHLRAETSKTFSDWCRKEKIRCLYFLANGRDAQTLQCAYSEGFKLVDVRVEMEIDLRNWLQPKETRMAIHPLTKKVELSSIQTLARKSHRDSRFFKDLNFDRIKCEKLYEKWIYRDFETGNILGYYPDEKEIVKGYISFSMESVDVVRIGLIAVEDDYRGRGIGSALLNKTIATSKELNAKKLIVVTQGTNTNALRLYEKAGFRISDVKLWFHRWFE